MSQAGFVCRKKATPYDSLIPAAPTGLSPKAHGCPAAAGLPWINVPPTFPTATRLRPFRSGRLATFASTALRLFPIVSGSPVSCQPRAGRRNPLGIVQLQCDGNRTETPVTSSENSPTLTWLHETKHCIQNGGPGYSLGASFVGACPGSADGSPGS